MLCIKDTTVRSAHFIASGKHDPHFIVSGKESEGVSHLNMSDSLRPHQASLSMGLSRQEYWSGLRSLLQASSRPRDLAQASVSPAPAGRFFTTSAAWEALN